MRQVALYLGVESGGDDRLRDGPRFGREFLESLQRFRLLSVIGLGLRHGEHTELLSELESVGV